MNYTDLSPKPISASRLLHVLLVDPDINFEDDGQFYFMAFLGKTQASPQVGRALFWTLKFQAFAWYYALLCVKVYSICATSSPEGFVQGRVDFISSGIHVSLALLLLNWIRFAVKAAPRSFRNWVHLSNT